MGIKEPSLLSIASPIARTDQYCKFGFAIDYKPRMSMHIDSSNLYSSGRGSRHAPCNYIPQTFRVEPLFSRGHFILGWFISNPCIGLQGTAKTARVCRWTGHLRAVTNQGLRKIS